MRSAATRTIARLTTKPSQPSFTRIDVVLLWTETRHAAMAAAGEDGRKNAASGLRRTERYPAAGARPVGRERDAAAGRERAGDSEARSPAPGQPVRERGDGSGRRPRPGS